MKGCGRYFIIVERGKGGRDANHSFHCDKVCLKWYELCLSIQWCVSCCLLLSELTICILCSKHSVVVCVSFSVDHLHLNIHDLQVFLNEEDHVSEETRDHCFSLPLDEVQPFEAQGEAYMLDNLSKFNINAFMCVHACACVVLCCSCVSCNKQN